MTHWQLRSMMEAMRESPPARSRPVMLVMSKAFSGSMKRYTTHMVTAISSASPSKWNRG
ncbi:Uncharacterised protein [uncultured Blautia sp.]|nr:Uncharacterised protein [uncultured Blautia sp.]